MTRNTTTIECAICGEQISENTPFLEPHGQLCSSCRDEYYKKCYDCGEYFLNSDINRYDGHYWCDDHCPNGYSANFIKYYDYRPDDLYNYRDISGVLHSNNNTNNKRFFGIELEVENTKNHRHNIKTLKTLDKKFDNWVWVKRDGSLGSYGIEVVTYPISYEFFMKHFTKVRRELYNGGYRGNTGNCGLHVHVNRESFRPVNGNEDDEYENIAKLLIVVNRLWDTICCIDRRSSGSRSNWASKNRFESEDIKNNLDIKTYFSKDGKLKKKIVTDVKGYEEDESRYRAVNLNNRNTIEFRFFSSTTKRRSVIASIQFVNILCEMAVNLDMFEVQKITKESMFDFIVKNHRDYKDLIKYLLSRKLFKEYESDEDIINSKTTEEFVEYSTSHRKSLQNFKESEEEIENIKNEYNTCLYNMVNKINSAITEYGYLFGFKNSDLTSYSLLKNMLITETNSSNTPVYISVLFKKDELYSLIEEINKNNIEHNIMWGLDVPIKFNDYNPYESKIADKLDDEIMLVFNYKNINPNNVTVYISIDKTAIDDIADIMTKQFIFKNYNGE